MITLTDAEIDELYERCAKIQHGWGHKPQVTRDLPYDVLFSLVAEVRGARELSKVAPEGEPVAEAWLDRTFVWSGITSTVRDLLTHVTAEKLGRFDSPLAAAWPIIVEALRSRVAPPAERDGEALVGRIMGACSVLTKQAVPPGVIPRNVADAIDWLEGVAKQVSEDFDYETRCLKLAEETSRRLHEAENKRADALRSRPAPASAASDRSFMVGLCRKCAGVPSELDDEIRDASPDKCRACGTDEGVFMFQIGGKREAASDREREPRPPTPLEHLAAWCLRHEGWAMLEINGGGKGLDGHAVFLDWMKRDEHVEERAVGSGVSFDDAICRAIEKYDARKGTTP